MIPSSYKPITSDSPPSSSNNAADPEDDKHLKWNQRLLKRIQAIDRGFIVSKLFYFFFYTALGALFPFFGLYYKQLWLSPVQTGLLLALRPSVKLVCLPLWRMVTDRYSKPKVVYFISIFGWLIGYYGQTFVFVNDIPCYSINVSTTASSLLQTTPLAPINRSSKLLNISSRKLSDTFESWDGKMPNLIYLGNQNSKNKQIKSRVLGGYHDKENGAREFQLAGLSTRLNEQESELQIKDGNEQQQLSNEKGSQSTIKQDSIKQHLDSSSKRTDEDLSRNKVFSSNIESEREIKEAPMQDTHSSFIHKNSKTAKRTLVASVSPSTRLSVYQSSGFGPSRRPKDDFRVKYNFWVFRSLIVIVILTEIITTPTPMLADSAVVQAIANTDSEYGKQRLFGSLGLALSAILIAVWVTFSTNCNYTDTINYLPCFYLFEIALGATVIVSLFFKFETPEKKEEEEEITIMEALKLFKSPRAAFFLCTVFVLGFCHSVQISFLFWFLQDIGGTPVLFGIIILVYCLAEVIMYFISNWVLEAIGQQGTICLALACYTARFLMYGNLKDPWLIIPMELVQGVTYGGVWSVAINYVKVPKEASVMAQSILHGAYWGVGMALGSIISGIVIQFYGAQAEFLAMAAIIFALFVVHIFIEIYDRVKAMEEEDRQRSDEAMDDHVLRDAKKKGKQPDRYIGAAAAPLVPCLLYGR